MNTHAHLLAGLCGLCLAGTALHAADYQWDGEASIWWGLADNWSANVIPTATDNVTGNTVEIDNQQTVFAGNYSLNNLTLVQNYGWILKGSNAGSPADNGSTYTFNVLGNLSNTGTDDLNFRNGGNMTQLDVNVSGTVTVGGTGSLYFGNFGDSSSLYDIGNVTVAGLTTVESGAMLGIRNLVGSEYSGTVAFNGGLVVNGKLDLNAGINTSGVYSGTGGVVTAAWLSGTGDVEVNYRSALTSSATAVLTLNGSENATFSGHVRNDGRGDNASAQELAIIKDGSGIQTFDRGAGNSYKGDTTINGGGLILNNTWNSGSGLGLTIVNDGALLGGTGGDFTGVSEGVILNAGGQLSPGDAATTAVESFNASTVTWNSDDNTAGMIFELSSGTSADQLIIAGAFARGSGESFIFDLTSVTSDTIVGTTYTLVTFASTDFSEGDFAYTSSDGVEGYFSLHATSLDFTVTAIPEARSYALWLSLGLLFWRMRASGNKRRAR